MPLPQPTPNHAGLQYTGVKNIDGPLVFMDNVEGVAYDELVEVATPDGELRLGQVLDVTSSSALRIIRAMPQKDILFVPDCNLGQWVADQVPEKTFHFFHGGCPVHIRLSAQDVAAARAAHPDAKLLVHPECRKEVSSLADYVGSTTGIMAHAKNSDAKSFIIGTENSILQHLQFECPDKAFYPLSKACICQNMRLTTLIDVYRCLLGQGGEEISLDEETRLGAKRCIDAMLAFG